MGGTQKYVLLVEDDPFDAELLLGIFGQISSPVHFMLEHLERLDAALERVARPGLDVVLLDLSLPDARGLDALARIVAAAPHLPVVILSGLDDHVLALQAVQEGAQDYLIKGQVEGPVLGRALLYAIERKAAQEGSRRLQLEKLRRAEAEAAERRSRFLSEASRALTTSFSQGIDAMLTTLAETTVPFLADCCSFDVFDPSGDLRRVTVVHAEPSMAELAGALQRYPPRLEDGHNPLIQALDSVHALLFDRVPEHFVTQAAQSEEHRALLRALAPRDVIIAPLIARGRTLGVMTLMASSPDRHFGREELALAEELSSRAALAVDNARLYFEAQQVIGVVSHDLRNPLNVIIMGVGGLLRHSDMPSERRTWLLEKLNRAAHRMNRLIQDLLDVSRIQSGPMSLSLGRYELQPLMTEIGEMLRPLAEEKTLELEINVSPNLPAVHIDHDRMLQVFSNLVGNAIKFTHPGGRIALIATQTDREIQFAIEDNGPGIPPETLPHIFERFWQGQRTDRQGAGLGLAIARGIVQAHRGRIWVESQEGRGSTFYFTVPVAGGVDLECHS